MSLVPQPSPWPTRKLSVATLASLLMAWAGLAVQNLWPDWYDATVWVTTTPVVAFAIAYMVRDLDNSPLDLDWDV